MRWLVLTLFCCFSTVTAAATINSGGGGGGRWVSVYGKIDYGDDAIFKQKIDGASDVVVLLDSPGGNVIAGLGIGDLIHEKRFATIVSSSSECASICAVIWLGGEKRMASEGARIGFHAAYALNHGEPEISSVANALIGAYFARIGLEQRSIMYLTEAAPRDMRWLTTSDARDNGIAFVELPEGVTPRPAAEPVMRAPEPEPTARPEPPALSEAEAVGAARLTRRFNERYAATGMPGIEVSINACYQRALELRSWDSAVYCTGLDVLAMLVDAKVAEAAQVPATVLNGRPQVLKRSNLAASMLGFPPDLLRQRGSAVALVAASQIDTTEEPSQPVHIEAKQDTITSLSVGHDAPPCRQMASEWGQIDAGLGHFVGGLCALAR